MEKKTKKQKNLKNITKYAGTLVIGIGIGCALAKPAETKELLGKAWKSVKSNCRRVYDGISNNFTK